MVTMVTISEYVSMIHWPSASLGWVAGVLLALLFRRRVTEEIEIEIEEEEEEPECLYSEEYSGRSVVYICSPDYDCPSE